MTWRKGVLRHRGSVVTGGGSRLFPETGTVSSQFGHYVEVFLDLAIVGIISNLTQFFLVSKQ